MKSDLFSGSYDPADIVFLLRETALELTPVAQKEKYLQAGTRHYSDMLSAEKAPDEEHQRIYAAALATGATRLARESLSLAKAIAQAAGGKNIVLASLARAGCPLGVMLCRGLRFLGRDCIHFGISIIRDRGLDPCALNYIRNKYPDSELFFVDGWTGKGVIAGELARSLPDMPTPRLVVLADPCGAAWLSASHEDWLIPFGIMGATVSGLVSRTLWAENDFHRCMLWRNLRPWDQSRALADAVSSLWTAAMANEMPPAAPDAAICARAARLCAHVVEEMMAEFGITSANRVKPGIAEATRALLRRVPERVLLDSRRDEDTRLLRKLAAEHNVPIIEAGSRIAPYKAITIIKKVL